MKDQKSPTLHEKRALAKDNHVMSEDDPFSDNLMNRIRQLEGQCTITSKIFLSFSCLKAVCIGIPVILSIIGLFLLKYFPSFRVKVFYTQLSSSSHPNTITHIFVKGSDTQQILPITRIPLRQSTKYTFKYQQLSYELGQDCIPIALHYHGEIQKCMQKQYLLHGLSEDECEDRRRLYGNNSHLVNLPSYPVYMFQTMTELFFIIQYLTSVVYVIGHYYSFAAMMIAFTLLTTSINYILLYRSYQKIKLMAEKQYPVTVRRDSQLIRIKNTDLVPGDLYLINSSTNITETKDDQLVHIPGDSIVVSGELFTNEMNLTGENVPIGKYAIRDLSNIQSSQHWLYEGSKIVSARDNTVAMLVHGGFTSRKGRILRKILHKTPSTPQFFRTLVYFLVETTVVGCILYVVTLPLMLSKDISRGLIAAHFLDFLTWSIPAALPIFFNLVYSFCLLRLGKQAVIGVDPQKSVSPSSIKVMCFDKTGTLTQSHLKIAHILMSLFHQQSNHFQDITANMQSHQIISGLFCSCHSLQQQGEQLTGDEVDLRMFNVTGCTIVDKANHHLPTSIMEIASKSHPDQHICIVKINQYQSRFQSMSVLVYDERAVGGDQGMEGKQWRVYAKGAPQLMASYVFPKPLHIIQKTKQLALQGFRSIAFSYKNIDNEGSYMNATRQEFLVDTTLLGLVAFQNKLKDDAITTIQLLTQADIQSKIITGDNLYVAIQTALQVGILKRERSLLVLQGKNMEPPSIQQQIQNPQGRLLQFTANGIKQETITLKRFYQDYNNRDIPIPVAVDNDFLSGYNEMLPVEKCVIFARMTPQSKARIIRMHKDILLEEYQNQSICRPLRNRVGMVGDGANDLLAIKAADVGVAITQSNAELTKNIQNQHQMSQNQNNKAQNDQQQDAIYGATFAITHLSKLTLIINQGKNSQRLIMQVSMYYHITLFIKIILMILLVGGDTTFFGDHQLLYATFITVLPLCLLMCLPSAQENVSPSRPNSNFFSLSYHLLFYGNIIIFSAGMGIGWWIYSSSPDYYPNPNPYITYDSGYNSKTLSVTCVYVLMMFFFSILPPLLYRSSPWKMPIYKEKVFCLWVILNVALCISMIAGATWTQYLQLIPIAGSQVISLLAVICCTILIACLYNSLIQKLCQ